MKTKMQLISAIVAVLLVVGNAQAATFSLSAPGQIGNAVTVAPNGNFTVNVLMNASEVGNTFEVFLGYDVSSKTTPGLGGTPTLNKLALISSTTEVADSIDAGFTVFRSAKVATAREATNSALGGRPYGLKVVGARPSNAAGGTLTLFSLTFQNNMASGNSTAIVISDAGAGTSYTTGWKHGSTTSRGSYVLQVVSQEAPTYVLSVTPASQDVAWIAGATTFDVSNTGGGEMAWSAEVVDGAEWLHLTSGSGINAGTVSVDIDQNGDTAARTGTIRITAAGATGSPVDVTVVQAKHPWPGDSNEDGIVNFSDYLNFSVGFGSTGTPGTMWGQGDFNEDGVVNFSDYLVLSSNFGSGGAVSADEVAKFQAASASFEDASQAEAVQQTLPCTPLAMALMAVIGLALYGLGSSFRNERQ